ncbi:MAG: helix-turn-helix domain-containing protein, partial [Prevotellaceae bacterium]|nr:helix-turn-helix domain-containing protein [Prevotellaceae bacterium]
TENIGVEHYFALRNTFIQPAFSVNAYAKTHSERAKPTYPELYFLLLNERNRLCELQNLPVYLVAGSNTVFEMAEYLPQNEKELLEIKGFGPAKVEKYGRLFLHIIDEYCRKHKLASRMEEKAEKRQRKKKEEKLKKAPKGESGRISLEMYRSGKSMEEIAKERNLAVSTIGTHLAHFVRSGELDIALFTTEEQRKLAGELLKNRDENTSEYKALSERFSNIEIMMLLAWVRRKNEDGDWK